MKTYIVTESNKESNLLLRSWVCTSKPQAEKCLKKRYDIACNYSILAGIDNPVDCTDCGFFFMNLMNGMAVKYEILESETFTELED